MILLAYITNSCLQLDILFAVEYLITTFTVPGISQHLLRYNLLMGIEYLDLH